MKKILLVCVVLFITSVACKKENIGGGGLCACSPITGPELNLVIKNNAGDDLLSDKTVGYYSKDKIQLFRKDENGKVIPIDFAIRPPFSYGDEKFMYNSLFAAANIFLKKDNNNIIYLKLGEGKIYELKLSFNQQKYDVDKLLIDNKEAEKAQGNVVKYVTIFYLTE